MEEPHISEINNNNNEPLLMKIYYDFGEGFQESEAERMEVFTKGDQVSLKLQASGMVRIK